jgi:hypothetical protein
MKLWEVVSARLMGKKKEYAEFILLILGESRES